MWVVIFVFVLFLSYADFLCGLGPGLSQPTSEPLHHRGPEGDAAAILRLASHTQHGTVRFSSSVCLSSPSVFIPSVSFRVYIIYRDTAAASVFKGLKWFLKSCSSNAAL